MHRLRYAVGLATLAAVVFGAWFLLGAVGGDEDPQRFQLRVEFFDARGLRPGADVRYRGVPVGTVRKVGISDDGGKAVVELFLDGRVQEQARLRSSFWIVSPRFSGLTTGATGLDTLVRDTYVAFHTPADAGPPLPSGSLITGRERPPPDGEQETLEPLRHGDLLMTLLVPENHGLRPGAQVVFRGVVTGDVRSVALAKDGTHVEIGLRVDRAFRHTVTDQTRFWIARPRVSGALFSGFTVSDARALLDPFVGYYTETAKGLPVEDGYRVAASVTPPDVEVSEVPPEAVQASPEPAAQEGDPIRLVRVVYAAVEEDWMSPDDLIRRQGTGLLLLDRAGRAVVLTARSLVDASYTERDTFGGDPDIAREQIKVLLPSGPVLRAGRNWVEPGGADLALLVLEGSPPDLATTAADRLAFAPEALTDAALTLRVAGESGSVQETPLDRAALPAVAEHRGGVVLGGGLVLALLGQTTGTEPEPALVPLGLLPEELRPGN